jgi:hypothetical protein
VTGLAVSLHAFPARAHVLAIEAAACILDLMAGIMPELLIGFTQTLDGKSILRKQDRIGQAFTRLATIAAEAMRERTEVPDLDADPCPNSCDDFHAMDTPLQPTTSHAGSRP